MEQLTECQIEIDMLLQGQFLFNELGRVKSFDRKNTYNQMWKNPLLGN